MLTNKHETPLVDAHCHLWRKELSAKTWLTPDLKPWFRTFDPGDLSEVTERVGVDACVLIEAGKTPAENQEMQAMAASSSLIPAFIAYVDLESPTLGKELDQWQQDAKFRGVRMGFEGHPDARVLQRSSVINGIKEIARRGLVCEFLVRTSHLADLLAVCEEVNDLKGIIEHLAKPDYETGANLAEWRRGMRALAKNTNLNCKLSLSPSLEQIERRLKSPKDGWPAQQIKPCVEFVIAHFGFDRLLWGSDWPVCLLLADYYDTWKTARSLLATATDEDNAKVFGANAIKFYRLDPQNEK